jgi:DNA-binding XRE family transcriptional regulator
MSYTLRIKQRRAAKNNMETQIVNNYEYHGLGVPVTLKQVQLVNLRGDWYPKIDVEQVASELFESLLKKARTTPLTGEEIEFIRIHLNLSQTQFSQTLEIARTTLARWEKAGAKFPKTRKITKQCCKD